MGFLSRKSKRQAVALEEQHPIVEELQEMEEVVPEYEDPQPADVSAQQEYVGGYEAEEEEEAYFEPEPVPVEESESAPEPVAQAAPAAPAPVEAPTVDEVEDEDDGRMKASDLLAPMRYELIAEREAEEEVPVKTAEVFVFANQKGGVAKTTTTLNLAVAFAESGYRVLCIDLDPPGNLTMSQGIDPDKVEKSLYD